MVGAAGTGVGATRGVVAIALVVGTGTRLGSGAGGGVLGVAGHREDRGCVQRCAAIQSDLCAYQ